MDNLMNEDEFSSLKLALGEFDCDLESRNYAPDLRQSDQVANLKRNPIRKSS